MKTIVWRAVALEVLALVAVFALAYGAGANSGGLSMLDFGALPFAAGVRLWAAGLLTVVAVLLLGWLGLRIVQPLQQLTTYSENLDAPDLVEPELPASNDDFAAIAEKLHAASERLAAAAADQRRLSELEQRIAAFADEARRIREGDLAVHVAPGQGALGEAFDSINAALDVIARVLESARTLSENTAATAQKAGSAAQQVGKTLVEQHGDLAAATSSFDGLPPSIKQVADNSEAVARAAQSAAASAEQARQQALASQSEAQRLGGSLRSAADVLANLRQASEHVCEMLRALSTVSERANLLALNAAIEAARAGQAGRSSWIVAEQFRDLAQESNVTGAELMALMQSVQHDCQTALNAVEGGAQVARESEQQAGRAAQSAESAASAVQEAGARAEVIGLAAARQADAARAVSGALQSSADLQQAASQQVRQTLAVIDEVTKLQQEVKAALSVLRSGPAQRAEAARAAAAAAGVGQVDIQRESDTDR